MDNGRPAAVSATASGTPFELVLVTYRSARQVAGLLAGLPPALPVAVVDNSGDVDGVRALVEARPHGRYVDGGGTGFAAAANLGARTSLHEHLVFGNPDTRPDVSVLAALVDDLADPACASSAANLLGQDGSSELGVAGWEPSVGRTLVHAVGLHRLAPRAGLFARLPQGAPADVDWTSGACMAVRRSTFLELGGFDETFFVYSEDVAFGRRVREAGLRQRMRSDLVVPHGAGGSGAPSLEMMRLRGASMAEYVHGHNDAVRARTMVSVLVLGYGVRVLQRLLAKDRVRAAEHAAYVAGLVTRRAWVGGQEVARTRRSAGSRSVPPRVPAADRRV